MQPVARPIYLLHNDAALLVQLQNVPGLFYRVHQCVSWSSLSESLRRSPPTALAVVDPLGPGGTLTDSLRELLREFPSATVVAALEVDPNSSVTLTTLLDWGVAEWWDLGRENTPAALARRLRAIWSLPAKRLLTRALPNGLPTRQRMLVTTAVEVVAAGGSSPELANALGVAMRTLPRRCERADLPPPRRLLAWLRILLASDLLDDDTRSTESVARATGYSGSGSLKTGIRNLLGLKSVAELREQGAFETVSERFSAELFELREQARSRGKPARTWLH